MDAQVWQQREQTVFSVGWRQNLTKYVKPGEAFLNDNYRIGAMNPEYRIRNITFFPFWEAWGLLLAELLALGYSVDLLWLLLRPSEPARGL